MSRVWHNFGAKIHPSWILYTSFAGVILSIALTVASGEVIFGVWPWLVCALGLIFYSLKLARRVMLIAAFLAGLMLGNSRLAPELAGREIWQNLVGQTIIVTGSISDDPTDKSGQTIISLSSLKLAIADSNLAQAASQKPQAESERKVAGVFYIKLRSSEKLERSDIITLQGTLSAGFGTYAGMLSRPELVAVRRAEVGDIFARVKQSFAQIIKKLIRAPEADLGLGYLMGLKSGLPDGLADTLRAVGMTHVVVASGAHLGILASAARKLCGYLSKFAGLLGSLLLIASFTLIVGFTPSMTRAALVSVLSLGVGYFGRQFTPLRLLLFVAMLTLLLAPLNCLHLGWQLSFASFFALLIIAPRLQKLFYGGKKPPWLASMLLTSLAATLACAPILIYNFGTLSLLSFVANLFILPTLPYAMLLVFLTGALSFWPWLAGVIAQLATILLGAHIWLVNFLGEKTMFIFELGAGDPRIFLIYVPILILLARQHHKTK